jgi:hypothetical protein
MSYCSVTISSNNLSGQTVDVIFYPSSGGTIDLGTQTFPFTYVSNYYWGLYECYSPTYNYTYTIEVFENPTPTPTSTINFTPTNTSTPTLTPVTSTPTPTITKTPTSTPQPIYIDNLWRDGVFTNACSESGFGPANTTIYSTVPWGSLVVGDFIYGNISLTQPPLLGTGNIVSDGAIWVQFNISTGEVLDIGICP